MKYALLIYNNEAARPDPASPQGQAVYEAYAAFTEEITAADVNRGGEALHDTTTATTVRIRDEELVVTDGPFAETKEQLGGFYLVEAPDLDRAIAIAGKIPGAKYGSIEVRPVIDLG